MARLLTVARMLPALVTIHCAVYPFYIHGARLRKTARTSHEVASPALGIALSEPTSLTTTTTGPTYMEREPSSFSPATTSRDLDDLLNDISLATDEEHGVNAVTVPSKTSVGGEVASRMKRTATEASANLQNLGKGYDRITQAESEAKGEWLKEDEGRGGEESDSWAAIGSNSKEMQPFYLKDLPPTRVSLLFEGYERRYWEARQQGLDRLGNRRKFFVTNKAQGLTDEERDEFRRLAKRFTDKLADKTPVKRLANLRQRRRRYGIGDAKTEAQKQATHRKSRRNHLIRRLRKINGDLERGIVKVQWNANHDKMLQDLVAEIPLKAGDTLIELYRKYLELSHAPSCIELPS